MMKPSSQRRCSTCGDYSKPGDAIGLCRRQPACIRHGCFASASRYATTLTREHPPALVYQVRRHVLTSAVVAWRSICQCIRDIGQAWRIYVCRNRYHAVKRVDVDVQPGHLCRKPPLPTGRCSRGLIHRKQQSPSPDSHGPRLHIRKPPQRYVSRHANARPSGAGLVA